MTQVLDRLLKFISDFSPQLFLAGLFLLILLKIVAALLARNVPRLKRKGDVKGLIECLDRNNRSLVISAVAALGEIGDEEAVMR